MYIFVQARSQWPQHSQEVTGEQEEEEEEEEEEEVEEERMPRYIGAV